ncbi:hypothetical protein ACIBBE_42890 [Streptomyces sp. NPDC051644]|uniref:hypothetical protein n=1 Tax=Streptomyces sp. NPDC051644 TaxID=3365666 RepID=UPI00378C9A9F
MTLIKRLGLRTAGRRAALAGLLLMLGAPLAGAAQASPAPDMAPAALSAPAADPCDQLPKDSAAYKYCTSGNKGTDDSADTGTTTPVKDEDKKKKEGACASLKGTPGYKYCMGYDGTGEGEGDGSGSSDNSLDTITGDCKAPPELEAPGQGILGWIDSGPDKAPAARNPKAANADAYIYEQYGYAGLRWSTYDLGCGGALRNPMSATDNWFANRVFTFSKAWTALTVVLRQYATSDDLFNSLNPVVEQATHAVRDAVYSPWIGTSLLLLGTVIIYQARKKNLPDVTSQIAWALLVMTVATGVASYPVEASKMADKAINSTISAIDQAFASVDLNSSDSGSNQASSNGATAIQASYRADQGGQASPYSTPSGDRVQDSSAHGNMLVHSVLYQQWLRGELGDDDSTVARKYGFELFDAQALTWRETRLPDAERAKVIHGKQQRFGELAEKIKDEDPTAYAHLTGKEDGRLGAAFIAQFQAAASNLFSMAADLVIIGGKLSLKFLVIMFPALAVIGLHRRSSGIVKTAFNSALAAVINVPVFAMGGAVDVLVVREISDPQLDIPAWLKVVLLLLVSYVLWKMLRPLTRLSAMFNPSHNYLADGGSALTAPGRLAKGAAKYYLGTRYLKKFLGRQAGALEDIADAVGGDADDRPQQSGREESDSGYWSDSDSWSGGRPQDGPNNPSGSGGAGVLDTDPLHASYEPDNDVASDTRGRTRNNAYVPAGAVSGAAGTARAGRDSDVWDAEGWFVEDLDQGGRASARSLPVGSTSRSGRSDTTSGSLPAGTGPDAPLPLPSGGGAVADLPSQRNSDSSTPTASGQNTQGDLPGGPVPPTPEGDRPYVSPEASGPRVVPPTSTEDGGTVYQIFDPTGGGFSIRDERDDEGFDGGER